MAAHTTQWQRTALLDWFSLQSLLRCVVLIEFRVSLMNVQFQWVWQSAMRYAQQQWGLLYSAALKIRQVSLAVLIAALVVLSVGVLPAAAMLNDDHFDGNIFPLYAGNGSLVPPKVTLAESMQRKRPAILVFYVDDSSDCKEYASVVSRIDGFYGWAADIIALSVDMLPVKANYAPTEPGYYYKGYVPQTVVLDETGKVRLDAQGNIAYEQIDDVLREVFDLLPRSESVELKRRKVNELSTELVEQAK